MVPSMPLIATPSPRSFASRDIRISVVSATCLGMLLGCGQITPASTGGTGDDDARCRTAAPAPDVRVCQAALDLASTRCPLSWERPLTPACILGKSGLEHSYSGPSGGYLVSARSSGYGGWMCVYDPATRALIAESQYSDVQEYCCRSFAIWFGQKLDDVWPTPEQCNQALVDGGADARD
jgi:hypothetical protein